MQKVSYYKDFIPRSMKKWNIWKPEENIEQVTQSEAEHELKRGKCRSFADTDENFFTNLVEIFLDEFPRKPEDSRNVADYSKNANKHLQEIISFK